MKRPLRILAGTAIMLFFLWAIGRAADHEIARAHYNPGTHNAVHAIQQSWCGRANRECWQGNQAIRVAKCEAAWYWTAGIPAQARNGQYRGMMQMGASERAIYGHGPDPWSQARAAHRYYVASGRDWSPWTCQP